MLCQPSALRLQSPLRIAVVRATCLGILLACAACSSEPAPSSSAESAAPATAETDAASASESISEVPTTSEESSSEETAVTEAAIDRSGQVLRHAVFFAFKDESSEEDVQGVVDTFRALPSKIPEIIDFEWGVNNSPEGLDDGFTHCFLLTFKDEKGREVYLPHPDHKAFGDVLRPHLKEKMVFVIDYWGTPAQKPLESPLRHAVFFKFKDDAAVEDVQKVEQAFAALPSKIDTIKAFEWGKNNSPERHSHDFTHCFMVTFANDAGRATYLPHPDHQAFVEILKPHLDKVRVLDFMAAE
jgi:hypothetical protein